MKTSLIILATILFIVGIFLLAIRAFFSIKIPDLGFLDIDIICILIPVILIIFGAILFILGIRTTDMHIKHEEVTKKDEINEEALKMLDTRFAKGEITKEQYNDMKKELKK